MTWILDTKKTLMCDEYIFILKLWRQMVVFTVKAKGIKLSRMNKLIRFVSLDFLMLNLLSGIQMIWDAHVTKQIAFCFSFG